MGRWGSPACCAPLARPLRGWSASMSATPAAAASGRPRWSTFGPIHRGPTTWTWPIRSTAACCARCSSSQRQEEGRPQSASATWRLRRRCWGGAGPWPTARAWMTRGSWCYPPKVTCASLTMLRLRRRRGATPALWRRCRAGTKQGACVWAWSAPWRCWRPTGPAAPTTSGASSWRPWVPASCSRAPTWSSSCATPLRRSRAGRSCGASCMLWTTAAQRPPLAPGCRVPGRPSPRRASTCARSSSSTCGTPLGATPWALPTLATAPPPCASRPSVPSRASSWPPRAGRTCRSTATTSLCGTCGWARS
mmetsp:Transcript_12214/g.38273  ORF Transcript_12214/g.38273 Transcript_12214/m.38273 type:complete len:307 (-) Transcript_12214:846-1766(-)